MKIRVLLYFNLLLLLCSCLPDEASKRKQQAIEKAKMDSLFVNNTDNNIVQKDSSEIRRK